MGDCYVNALAVLLRRWREGWLLVHGTVTRLPYSSQHTPHAWLEAGNVVLDAEAGNTQSALDFYSQRRPRDVQRYEVVAACKHALFLRHCGPWHNTMKLSA